MPEEMCCGYVDLFPLDGCPVTCLKKGVVALEWLTRLLNLCIVAGAMLVDRRGMSTL